MNIIDYVIIGIVISVSSAVIYRKISGKSKGCSCGPEKCGTCLYSKKEKECKDDRKGT